MYFIAANLQANINFQNAAAHISMGKEQSTWQLVEWQRRSHIPIGITQLFPSYWLTQWVSVNGNTVRQLPDPYSPRGMVQTKERYGRKCMQNWFTSTNILCLNFIPISLDEKILISYSTSSPQILFLSTLPFDISISVGLIKKILIKA